MSGALHRRTACFETRDAVALLSMRGVETGLLDAPHAEEARSAVSKHAVRMTLATLIVASAGTMASSAAEPGPDVSDYDCTRTDNGETVKGRELVAAGFEVVSVGRFGQPNVMLADPKSQVRANCLVRTEPKN